MSKRKSRDISARRRRKSEKGFPWIYVIPFIVLVVIIGTIVYVSSSNPTTTITGPPFPFPCLGTEGLVLHIHDWLRITIEGQPVTIPQFVGIQNGLNRCFEPMHTHDSSGIIHIESPDATTQYTLGEFFQIWASSIGWAPASFNGTSHPIVFNSTDVLGYKANSAHQIVLLVDGKANQLFDGLNMNQLDYCNSVNGNSFPCAQTANGNPYYNGQTYPFGTNHTIVIEYT